MRAREISGQAPGGGREILAKALPLTTPFVIQIFPVYACNFACRYCIFSIDESKRGFISDKVMMDFALYKKCINDISLFPNKMKVLRIVGIGEPLLHKDIAGMVEYAVSNRIANIVEILTNASLLTPSMSDSLISAGLSRLVVSLQGVTKEKYQNLCGKDIDFENLISNLRYFYNRKKKAQVYIKIIDCALDNDDDKNRFYEIFGDICDTIAIEHAVPIHSGVDYERLLERRQVSVTQFGQPVSEVKICPQPFFTLQINPDGKIVPCYSFEYPGIMGDCNNQSLNEIWNGTTFRRFRSLMLDGINCASPACARCNIIKFRLFSEDNLNNDAGRLKKIFKDELLKTAA